MKSLKWITATAIAATLIGCGGSDNETGSGAAPSPSVQVTEVPAGLKITAALAGNPPPLVVREATHYAFNARIASGPHAGRNLAGTLLLQVNNDGTEVTQVEGLVIDTGRVAAAPGLQETFDTEVQTLRTDLRTQLEDLSATLRKALSASTAPAGSASPADAQSEALLQFKLSFAALSAQHRSGVANLRERLLADMTASLDPPTSPSSPNVPDTDLPVSGTVDLRGALALRLALSDDTTAQLTTDATAANGSLSGTLTGPAPDDLGSWTATPVPMPSVGNLVAGRAEYTIFCASCHTDNVRSNVFNVVAANNVFRLQAAIAGIGSMRFLQNANLSDQDLLDIVAYIGSAR